MVAKPYSLLQIDEVDVNESFLGDLWLFTTHQSLPIPHSYSIIASRQRMLAAIYIQVILSSLLTDCMSDLILAEARASSVQIPKLYEVPICDIFVAIGTTPRVSAHALLFSPMHIFILDGKKTHIACRVNLWKIVNFLLLRSFTAMTKCKPMSIK